MKSIFIWIWSHFNICPDAAAIDETLTRGFSVSGAAPPNFGPWAVYRVGSVSDAS